MIKRKLGEIFAKRIQSKHEFCTRCQADLTLQKGYDNELPYWICKGCGEMLINPAVETESGIVWVCDKCSSMLNIQPGFSESLPEWHCKECGFLNVISESEIYLSDDDYQESLTNPYKDMPVSDVIGLMKYQEVCKVDGYDNIYIVRNSDDGKLYIRKEHKTYDKSVYSYIKDNPISNIPKIIKMCESNGYLVIIEEFIDGKTIEEILEDGPIAEEMAIKYALNICYTLCQLHNAVPPIIHRDIKPSNVMITDDGRAFLIDINVAKCYSEGEIEDTMLLGTRTYAAPEQFGCGLKASSTKTDIYGLGILLNVMVTGKLPKEELAKGKVGEIVEKCISLEPAERYTDQELLGELESIS